MMRVVAMGVLLVVAGLVWAAGLTWAAAPAGLPPVMWERVRGTEAVVGSLAPTESPSAPATASLKDCLALAYRHSADFRNDQAGLVNARRAMWAADQRLFYVGTGAAERGRDPGDVVGNTFTADFTTRWEALAGGTLNTVVDAGTQTVFGDLVSQRPALQVSYDQPLVRGAGLDSSTNERVRSARTALLSQELTFYDAHQQLAQQIVEDYYGVLLAQGEVDIAQRAVDRAKQFNDRTQTLYTGEGIKEKLPPGVEWRTRVTIMDLGQAQLDWERAKQDLISRQQDYRDAMDRLLLDMGQQPGAEPKLTTSLAYQPQEYDQAALTKTALENSTELGRLALSQEDAEADRRIARSEARPDVIASAGVNDLGGTEGGVTLSTGWFTGVRLEVPFFDRNREQRVGQTDRALRVLEQRRVAARDRVSQGMQQQVRAASSSRARIDIGQQALAVAQKNREAAQAMFDEGLSDSLRVVDAEQRLVQAERSLLQEQVQYFLTTVRVRRALGEDITQGLPE